MIPLFAILCLHCQLDCRAKVAMQMRLRYAIFRCQRLRAGQNCCSHCKLQAKSEFKNLLEKLVNFEACNKQFLKFN
jgi:hypothetical protein